MYLYTKSEGRRNPSGKHSRLRDIILVNLTLQEMFDISSGEFIYQTWGEKGKALRSNGS